MSRDFRWVDDTWWRDWVFWVPACVTTGLVTFGVARIDRVWWSWGLSWILCFGFLVAVLGFVRTTVRTYRGE